MDLVCTLRKCQGESWWLTKTSQHHHLFTLLAGGKIYEAPIVDPKRVLDVGTGTGIWAIDFAEWVWPLGLWRTKYNDIWLTDARYPVCFPPRTLLASTSLRFSPLGAHQILNSRYTISYSAFDTKIFDFSTSDRWCGSSMDVQPEVWLCPPAHPHWLNQRLSCSSSAGIREPCPWRMDWMRWVWMLDKEWRRWSWGERIVQEVFECTKYSRVDMGVEGGWRKNVCSLPPTNYIYELCCTQNNFAAADLMT